MFSVSEGAQPCSKPDQRLRLWIPQTRADCTPLGNLQNYSGPTFPSQRGPIKTSSAHLTRRKEDLWSSSFLHGIYDLDRRAITGTRTVKDRTPRR